MELSRFYFVILVFTFALTRCDLSGENQSEQITREIGPPPEIETVIHRIIQNPYLTLFENGVKLKNEIRKELSDQIFILTQSENDSQFHENVSDSIVDFIFANYKLYKAKKKFLNEETRTENPEIGSKVKREAVTETQIPTTTEEAKMLTTTEEFDGGTDPPRIPKPVHFVTRFQVKSKFAVGPIIKRIPVMVEYHYNSTKENAEYLKKQSF